MAKSALRTVRKIPRLPRRKADSHKGDFGRVLIVGGSRGMIGAPALAASAALRAGADLVVGLIGPGVDASHAYERTHQDSLLHTASLAAWYLLAEGT